MLMRITARRVLMMAPVLIAALAVAIWAFCYSAFELTGGVGIRDSGFFSYPRYHAQLGDLPLWKDGEYQCIVRALPPDPLDLSLEVVDATDARQTELPSLTR